MKKSRKTKALSPQSNLEQSLYFMASKASEAAQTAGNHARQTAMDTLGIGDLVAITTIHVATDVVAHGFKAVSTTSFFVAKETTGLIIKTLREVREIGGNFGEAAVISALETIRAADKIGSESGRVMRKAILNTATLPHDILVALLTGRAD